MCFKKYHNTKQSVLLKEMLLCCMCVCVCVCVCVSVRACTRTHVRDGFLSMDFILLKALSRFFI